MKLEEVKDLKWRAEMDIANIMSEFEKKTDLKIPAIRKMEELGLIEK